MSANGLNLVEPKMVCWDVELKCLTALFSALGIKSTTTYIIEANFTVHSILMPLKHAIAGQCFVSVIKEYWRLEK